MSNSNVTHTKCPLLFFAMTLVFRCSVQCVVRTVHLCLCLSRPALVRWTRNLILPGVHDTRWDVDVVEISALPATTQSKLTKLATSFGDVRVPTNLLCDDSFNSLNHVDPCRRIVSFCIQTATIFISIFIFSIWYKNLKKRIKPLGSWRESRVLFPRYQLGCCLGIN